MNKLYKFLKGAGLTSGWGYWPGLEALVLAADLWGVSICGPL